MAGVWEQDGPGDRTERGPRICPGSVTTTGNVTTRRTTMKLKTLVLAAGAAAVGYVLGTKAGRAQFEQIKAKADELAHDPRVRSGVSSIAGEVKKSADKLPDPVAGAVRAAADAVQSAAADERPSSGTPTV
jgi:hypothetical protein